MINKDTSTPYRADEYDQNVVKTLPYYHFFHEETIELVRQLRPRPGKWLDTGGGSGTLLIKACREFPETDFYYADPSETMKQVAQKRINASENVTFLDCVSTQNLKNVTSETFDIISAVMCHHYLTAQQRSQAIQTCFDLLNSSGILIVFEHTVYTDPEVNQAQMLRWERFQIEQGRPPEKVKDHLSRFGRHYLPICVEEHLNLYRKTGFLWSQCVWRSCMQAGFVACKK